MQVIIDKKKIEVKKVTKFTEKFKSFKFQLEDITTGLCFPKTKTVSTYFFFQKIDIIMTDKDFNIKRIYQSWSTEKRVWPKRGVYYTFLLPRNIAEPLEIGDKLKVVNFND